MAGIIRRGSLADELPDSEEWRLRRLLPRNLFPFGVEHRPYRILPIAERKPGPTQLTMIDDLTVQGVSFKNTLEDNEHTFVIFEVEL